MSVSERLDDRYGRTHTRRSRMIGIGVFGILGVAAFVAFAIPAVTQSQQSVDATTTAYELIDAHTAAVSFQVSLPPGQTVACALEAQDAEHGVVGWKVKEFPATTAHTTAYTEQIPTVAQSVTALVKTCWIP